MSKTQAGARVSPGAVWLLYAETGFVFALFVFASIVSFSGLYSIGAWVGLPPTLYWALPLAIDLGIIGYKVAEVILRYDERKARKVKKAVFGTILFTTVSCLGNIVHVAALADPDPLHYWGGIGFAALMPWAVYLSASVLADLIVKPYRTPAAQVEPAPVQVAPAKAPARPRTPRKKPTPKPKPEKVVLPTGPTPPSGISPAPLPDDLQPARTFEPVIRPFPSGEST